MMPKQCTVQAEWLRDMYVLDANRRAANVIRELEAEKGTDILILDWTVDAAKRCGSLFLFNAMASNQMVLLSVLTRTSAPSEVISALASLKERGVQPKVVYVDDHCCGAWPSIFESIWPGAAVRLDVMHAMRRLTQTTSSTQHPWHGEFCAALSSAIYTSDAGELGRFRAAWKRAGRSAEAPSAILKKYVPRMVTDPARIVAAIDKVLNLYSSKKHCDMGELLTPATQRAWASLRAHVLAGCLCDPPDVQLNWYGDTWSVGGAEFGEVTSKRGSSALEGFHTHQKQWLGPLATHGIEAGTSLLRDGQLRWNRDRQRDSGIPLSDTRRIFDTELGLVTSI